MVEKNNKKVFEDKETQENEKKSNSQTSIKQKSKNSPNDKKKISENLKKIKEDHENQIESEKDKFLRLFAEFENYKKRTSKERLELFKTAGQEVIITILPVLDDFDRAIEQLSKIDEGDFLKGVKLMRDKLFNALKSKGLETVEVARETIFNLEIHEAITQIPAPDPSMKGKIIDVVEQGYKLGDKIIRYPKVVVGK